MPCTDNCIIKHCNKLQCRDNWILNIMEMIEIVKEKKRGGNLSAEVRDCSLVKELTELELSEPPFFALCHPPPNSLTSLPLWRCVWHEPSLINMFTPLTIITSFTKCCQHQHLHPTLVTNAQRSHPGWWQLPQATGPPWSQCAEVAAADPQPARHSDHLPGAARPSRPAARHQDVVGARNTICAWTRLPAVLRVRGEGALVQRSRSGGKKH